MPIQSAKEGNGTLALTGVSQALVGENLSRYGIIISNFSAVVVNIAFQEGGPGGPGVAPTASATTGLQLANGGSLTFMGESCFLGAIAVFGASGNIGWVEF